VFPASIKAILEELSEVILIPFPTLAIFKPFPN
jgi:hypothetical protein